MKVEDQLSKYAEEEKKYKNVLAYEKTLSEPEKIITISQGCPICNCEVKGSENSGYYCKKCNVTFTQKDLENTEMLNKHNNKNIIGTKK